MTKLTYYYYINGGKWQEVYHASSSKNGLAKDGCPGRQAAWVDYNSDDRLDIYVACGRGKNEGMFPNQLFQQTPEGHFVDVAAQVGLNLQSTGKFLWMDTDLDGDLDLFWADWQ